MSTIIEEMISKYEVKNIYDKKNAMKEVVQEIILCGLSRAGFFSKAAFYGGTALRIFYGLDRFSEDLDFSLMTTDSTFDLSEYFPTLEKEIAAFGLRVKIENKIKNKDTAIQSAFLKGNTKEHLLLFYSNDNFDSGVNSDEVMKIKFEVDTEPPAFANYEVKYQLLPSPYEVRLYDSSSLFAGKIHAVICRAWKSRIKGRDLYDYIFYLSRGTKVNLKHLKARLVQTGIIKEEDEFTLEILKQMLIERFDSIDYENAKQDVVGFIKNPSSLSLWNADFFKKITENLQCS